MIRRKLPVGVSAREGLEGAVTALVRAVLASRNCCEAAREIMTMSPGTQVRLLAEAAEHQARFLPPARYRHPGDVIRLHVETAG
jgi:hypothetical protein